jgi:hypothetical protein
MKRTFIKQFLSVVAISGVSVAVHADDTLRGQQVITAAPELTSQGAPIPAETMSDSQTTTDGVVRAPAPPLTAMWVYAVASSTCNGWEYTVGLTATTCDHGGAQLRTAVLEIGYGSNSIAWMNGGIQPNSAMYKNTPVCITGGSYTWPCTAGQTIVGFLREYNLDGHQGGVFKYQNTSINSPWNTLGVQISIR